MKLCLGLLRFSSRILCLLPYPFLMALGDFVGILWFDILRIRRKVIFENLSIAFPELNESEKTKIGRTSCYNMGRSLIEFLMLPGIRQSEILDKVQVIGEENFWQAREKGKGVLLLSLHLGSADFSLNGLAAKGFPIELITKTFTLKWLNRIWFAIRGRFGVQFIGDRKSTYDILKGLNQGKGVVFVLDQFTGPPIGIETTFFGRRTGTAMGLAVFALKTKAPIVPVYSYRGADNLTYVVFEPEMSPVAAKEKSEFVRLNTQQYADKIEKIITMYPASWLWVHRRWKEYVVR